jgi:hypothetical protein
VDSGVTVDHTRHPVVAAFGMPGFPSGNIPTHVWGPRSRRGQGGLDRRCPNRSRVRAHGFRISPGTAVHTRHPRKERPWYRVGGQGGLGQSLPPPSKCAGTRDSELSRHCGPCTIAEGVMTFVIVLEGRADLDNRCSNRSSVQAHGSRNYPGAAVHTRHPRKERPWYRVGKQGGLGQSLLSPSKVCGHTGLETLLALRSVHGHQGRNDLGVRVGGQG